jgi:molybdenum cofactor guanylyltransferase
MTSSLAAPPLPSAGAILAGGFSRRFGSPKALAEVGGISIVRRVLAAQARVLPVSVVVTVRPDLYRDLGVPTIPDEVPGVGPLGGIHAALLWARERGMAGICTAPCDAPFVAPGLYRVLLRHAAEGADAVLPASRGIPAVEPLFGWYSVRLLPLLEGTLRDGPHAVHRFAETLPRLRIVPRPEVERIGEPRLLFLNVNTPADLELARRSAAVAGEPAACGVASRSTGEGR